MITEAEFRKRWEEERALYAALGEFVVHTVRAEIDDMYDSDNFFKIPPHSRPKSTASLIEKAFYRDKGYVNPYDDITDKVGARFVVLVSSDIPTVEQVIASCKLWNASKDRDYQAERDEKPEVFTYESVHYVIRLQNNIEFNSLILQRNMSCEIQVRTLLQHACSELTHDTIYKSKTEASSKARRSCSKAMALVEATDDCFLATYKDIEYATIREKQELAILSATYEGFVGISPENTKISERIISALINFVDEDYRNNLPIILEKNNYIAKKIQLKFPYSQLHRESVIILVYYLLLRKKHQLCEVWPLTRNELEPLANDVGESIPL